jgi:glucokinase
VASDDLVIAVDIGGTKMAAAVVDEAGAVQRSVRMATPVSDDAEVVWHALREAVTTLVPEAGGRGEPRARACGVGCGGPMRGGGEKVSPLNIRAWRDFPLQARLADLTGVPTWVDNDAKALALAEGWKGVAVGCSDYLSMVVSTGVGAGIVLDGRLLDGASGNAGHLGHVVVVPDGRPCECGGYGCLEAEASGPAIAAATGGAPSRAQPEVVQRTGRLVGLAVADAANLLDLRLASVAGSVALGFGAPFFAAAQAEIDVRARLDHSRGTRILPSGLGSDGPIVGAAAVAWRGVGSLPIGARPVAP